MKYLFSFLLLCVSVVLVCADDRYAEYAEQFCDRVRDARPDDEEKTLLLNLMYWSWRRSASLMTFQKAAADHVKQSGQLMNEAMEARLNPAKLSSVLHYPSTRWRHDVAAFDAAHAAFKKELEKYRFIAATYAQCIEYLVKEADLRQEIRDCVLAVRENSRLVCMQVMKEQVSSISSIMDQMKKIMSTFRDQMRSAEEFDETTRGLMDYLMSYASSGVFGSFAKFDKKYNEFNGNLWRTLATSYALSNLLWETTEVVRIQFYAEHYAQLAQAFYCGINQQHLLRMAFNADGFIEAEQRQDYIPPC